MREQPLNLHPALGELPVFEPSPELWPRIRAAELGRRRARRVRRFAALAAGIAVVAGAWTLTPRAPDAPLAQGLTESQALEREWRELGSATRPAADVARLHMIDTALQAAYDRGAAADELEPLWRERNEALRGLIQSVRAESVTRI